MSFSLFLYQEGGKPMIYRRCPHCRKRVPEGEKCGCGYKREYVPPDKTRKLYHSGKWQKIRDTVISFYSGIDPYAKKQGRIEYAFTVHHIIPAEEDPECFWILDNLIPLSRASHDEVHARYRASAEEKRKAQEELRELIRLPEWAAQGEAKK